MTLDLIMSIAVSLLIICFICWKLNKEDEEFDLNFRDEEED